MRLKAYFIIKCGFYFKWTAPFLTARFWSKEGMFSFLPSSVSLRGTHDIPDWPCPICHPPASSSPVLGWKAHAAGPGSPLLLCHLGDWFPSRLPAFLMCLNFKTHFWIVFAVWQLQTARINKQQRKGQKYIYTSMNFLKHVQTGQSTPRLGGDGFQALWGPCYLERACRSLFVSSEEPGLCVYLISLLSDNLLYYILTAS